MLFQRFSWSPWNSYSSHTGLGTNKEVFSWRRWTRLRHFYFLIESSVSLAVKGNCLHHKMDCDVILSRIKWVYFCKVGITIIINTHGNRFLSESYCNYQICAVNLGTHLQIVHTFYFFSYLVFIEGSSDKDYFSVINNRNYLYLTLKCILWLFLQINAGNYVWVQFLLKLLLLPWPEC